MEKKTERNAARKSPAVRALERKFWSGAAVMTALVLVIAIFATLISYALPWSYDMTSGGIFTLSDGTKEALAELAAPVKIGAVYASGKEETMVKALLEKYDAASDLVDVEFLDAQASPALLSGYNIGDAQTVANGTIIINSGSRYQLLSDDDMYTYGSNGNLFYGEQDITGAIRYVTTTDLPVVYLTTGHGETALSEMTQATSLLTNEARDVRQLVMLQSDIPDDADVIVMASPSQDISEYEYNLLVTYLAGGGSLLLMLDPFLTADAAEFVYLNALTWEYGIDVTNNYVMEQSDSYHLSTSPLYLIPRYGDHEIVNTIATSEKLLILPIARGISTVEYDANKVSQTALLASSPNSWARFDMTSEETGKLESDVAGPIALAWAATRSGGEAGTSESRLVVIGDGSFAVGKNVTAQANGDFLVSCVNWLIGSRVTSTVPGKVINSNTMVIRGSDFTRLAVLCCAAMPLIMFAGALLIWRGRRNK